MSWVLLRDGWHSLTPRHDDDGARVAVVRVDPDDLATELAPVLAQVTAPEDTHMKPPHGLLGLPRCAPPSDNAAGTPT